MIEICSQTWLAFIVSLTAIGWTVYNHYKISKQIIPVVEKVKDILPVVERVKEILPIVDKIKVTLPTN